MLFIAVGLFSLGSCGNEGKQVEKKKVDTTTIKTPEELSLLNAQIAENPNDADLYNKRAKYYYMTRDMSAGIQDIEKAISLDTLPKFIYHLSSLDWSTTIYYNL